MKIDPQKQRCDFVYLFDVVNGNPNGDPDAGNSPRIDPETGLGLVTDVCLKRKVRNYVSLAQGGTEGYQVYVKEKGVLNLEHRKAYEAKGLKTDATGDERRRNVDLAQAWMCQTYFDIRMFGAVMSTEVNCGQVRGPVQFTFARSADPVAPLEQSITRMAVTNERDLEKERTMGRKEIVPYGLYRMHGFLSAPLAKQTGFCTADLELLVDALKNMFDHDRSAARGEMAARGLYLFEHSSELGSAPAHKLFDRVQVVKGDPCAIARSFSDYTVTVNKEGLPAGVILHELI